MREAFFISLANSCRPEPSEGRPLEPTELHLTLIETFESVKRNMKEAKQRAHAQKRLSIQISETVCKEKKKHLS